MRADVDQLERVFRSSPQERDQPQRRRSIMVYVDVEQSDPTSSFPPRERVSALALYEWISAVFETLTASDEASSGEPGTGE